MRAMQTVAVQRLCGAANELPTTLLFVQGHLAEAFLWATVPSAFGNDLAAIPAPGSRLTRHA